MADSDQERLARLEERIAGIQGDLHEIVAEGQRVRTRLHNLEGFTAAQLDAQRVNRRSEDRQYRRLELRIQVLTFVVGLVAIASPIATALLTGK